MQTRHTFTSPADLLRTLNAEGYMQAQEELLQQVQTSYEVLYRTASHFKLTVPASSRDLVLPADTYWQPMGTVKTSLCVGPHAAQQ